MIRDSLEVNIPRAREANPNAFAIIVGNSDYGKDKPPVEFAVRDAELFERYAVQALGVPSQNITTQRNATLSGLRVLFRAPGGWLAKQIQDPGKTDVFVYYSGHGAPDPTTGTSYLFPVDGQIDFLSETGFALDSLYANLGRLGVRSVTIFLDACFSGQAERGSLFRGIRPVIKITPPKRRPNLTIFAASSGDQISSDYEEKRHGLFSYFVLEGLRGAADQDGDARISRLELQRYLAEKVPGPARAKGRTQTPNLTTADSSAAVAVYQPAAAAAAVNALPAVANQRLRDSVLAANRNASQAVLRRLEDSLRAAASMATAARTRFLKDSIDQEQARYDARLIATRDSIAQARESQLARLRAEQAREDSTQRAAIASLTVGRIGFDGQPLTLVAGQSARVRARAFAADGRPLADRPLFYVSRKPNVALVDEGGLVVAQSAGTVYVAGLSGGRVDSLLVTVTAPAPVATMPPAAPTSATATDPTAGLPVTEARFQSVGAGGALSCGILLDQHVACWGADATRPQVVAGVTFTKVSIGEAHACGISASGDAYCWGANSQGQLGDGTSKDKPVPTLIKTNNRFTDISAGALHTCALTSDGAAYCWGSNRNGQIGDGSSSNRNKPSLVRGKEAFSRVVAGGGHTCGLSGDGKVYCWGDGWNGQVGAVERKTFEEPYLVRGDLRFRSLALGTRHTCALAGSGFAYCWGDNAKGQLGVGGSAERTTPDSVKTATRFAALSVGGDHSCALTADGTMECWGDNGAGQLGSGTTRSSPLPVRVTANVPFTAVAAGVFHTCGTTETGAAYCWGANSRGQLGDGTTQQRPTPVAVR